MEEEKKNIPEPQSEQKKNDCCSMSKNVKIVIIVIAVLVALGVIYRVNAYYKYKRATKVYDTQIKTLEKQSKEIQANYLKQANEAQKKILEEQAKALKELNNQ